MLERSALSTLGNLGTRARKTKKISHVLFLGVTKKTHSKQKHNGLECREMTKEALVPSTSCSLSLLPSISVVSFFKVDVYNCCTCLLGRPALPFPLCLTTQTFLTSHIPFGGERDRENRKTKSHTLYFFFFFPLSRFPILFPFVYLFLFKFLLFDWSLRQVCCIADSKKSYAFPFGLFYLFSVCVYNLWAALPPLMQVLVNWMWWALLANRLGYTSVILGSQIWPTKASNCLRWNENCSF